jgi:two-component system sensor histidine kinase PilS (NtrC family)
MDRLNGIVEEALAFARPTPVHRAAGDLAATVRTVTRFLEPDVAAAGVTLHVSGLEAPVLISFDTDRVKQVLINLIRNATEAAGPGGEVWVGLHEQPSLVEVRVEDSGPGVPEGVDPFVPFFTTKTRGTGLGLPTAHRIVAEHGGALFFSRIPDRTAVIAQFPRP